MEIKDLKNGNLTLGEFEEAFKDFNSKTLDDIANRLRRMVRDKRIENCAYFIGWSENGESDDYTRTYVRLGHISEEQAADWVNERYTEEYSQCLDAGYLAVDKVTYEKYGMLKIISNASDAVNSAYSPLKDDIPESIKTATLNYELKLRNELGFDYGWERIGEDANLDCVTYRED